MVMDTSVPARMSHDLCFVDLIREIQGWCVKDHRMNRFILRYRAQDGRVLPIMAIHWELLDPRK